MRRTHSFLAASAALLAVPAISLPLMVASAAPADATAACTGTSLVPSQTSGWEILIPTTAKGSDSFNCQLSVGSEGAPVARLQMALVYCNLGANISIDSQYGPQTEQAVENVQQYHRIGVDGIFGPITSSHMFWPVYGSNYTECAQIQP